MQSLERGLAVIRALAGPEPQTLTEVARHTELTRATARRFLLTLESLHYVRQRQGRFSLTPRVLELGFAYLSSLGLPEVAGPHLAHLVEQVHQSSSVSVLEGDDIVYVARVPTRRIMTVALSVGTRLPAHRTSMGRVLLAALGREACTARLARVDLAPATAHSISDLPALLDRLDQIAADGYALVDQELELGLRSIAVPIFDAVGETVAAVNLSVAANTMTPRAMRQTLLPPLRASAAAISRDLVGREPGGRGD